MKGKRILILRPDNIGDVILFTGALQYIRQLHPDAHITLAVQNHIVNLLELCPYIDACVPVNRLIWRDIFEHHTFPRKTLILKFIHSLNKTLNAIHKPFHTIIYPVKSPQVSHLEIIEFFKETKQILGINGCNLNEPDNGYPSELQPKRLLKNHLDVSRLNPWMHELSLSLIFLQYMGCNLTSVDEIKPLFWLSASDNNYLESIKTSEKRIVGLFPGASSAKKRWDVDNYGTMARELGDQIIFVIFGSPADKDLCDQVASSLRNHCRDVEILNLAGQTTLRELVKAIKACDLLLSTDTAGLHIAIAADIPSVGIIGGGHYGRFVPWGDPQKHIFLTKHMDCFHCNWKCIYQEAACVKDVPPQQVAAAAVKLLRQHNDHA